MIATMRAAQRNEYTNITHWIAVAQSFEAVGFTPLEYYLLRMCVSSRLSIDKSDTSRRRYQHIKDHRLLTVVVGTHGYERTTLTASSSSHASRLSCTVPT